MADGNCNPPSNSAANASLPENDNSDKEKCSQISSSCEIRVSSENGEEEHVPCKNLSLQSNADIASNDSSVKSVNENRYGVSGVCESKTGVFLRPSALLTGSTSFTGGNIANSAVTETSFATKCQEEDTHVACKNQFLQSNADTVSKNPLVRTLNENRYGVISVCEANASLPEKDNSEKEKYSQISNSCEIRISPENGDEHVLCKSQSLQSNNDPSAKTVNENRYGVLDVCRNPPSNSAANASLPENENSDKEKCSHISNSCEIRVSSENGDEHLPCKSQSLQPNNDPVSNDLSAKTVNENRYGVLGVCRSKTSLFLRPSALSSGSTSFTGGNIADSPAVESSFSTKCPLKVPKLNLPPSRLGNVDNIPSSSMSSKLPFQQLKNPFSNAVTFENDKNESLTSKNIVLQTDSNGSGSSTGEKLIKPFSCFSNTKPIGVSSNTNSSVLTTNFVFGQNLHERVADGIATANNTDNKIEATSSNGTSDMLFTSVLISKEIKGNMSNNTLNNAREPFSLIEDAARCEEARANKRKYQEVLVTTGEEAEENVLQVNVKLFAFDSGTWVERGRGTLRLNDKNCDGTVISRIVIRTLGSLRVVLNTKIWSGMSLSRASERSIRLTAMDPNGQLKIFLIQASPDVMSTLYRFLEVRFKRCLENQQEPEKKKLEVVSNNDKEVDGGEEIKT